MKSSWESGERCKLPQRDLLRSPSRNRIGHFSFKICRPVASYAVGLQNAVDTLNASACAGQTFGPQTDRQQQLLHILGKRMYANFLCRYCPLNLHCRRVAYLGSETKIRNKSPGYSVTAEYTHTGGATAALRLQRETSRNKRETLWRKCS